MTLTNTISLSDTTRTTISSLSYGTMFILLDNFIVDAIQEMPIWLLVMTMVVVADLFAARYHFWKIKKGFRISYAIRSTLAKLSTYYASVVAMIVINTAYKDTLPFQVHKVLIALICLGELVSIANHYLMPQGYQIDLMKIFSLFFRKSFELTRDELKDVMKKNKLPEPINEDNDDTKTIRK